MPRKLLLLIVGLGATALSLAWLARDRADVVPSRPQAGAEPSEQPRAPAATPLVAGSVATRLEPQADPRLRGPTTGAWAPIASAWMTVHVVAREDGRPLEGYFVSISPTDAAQETETRLRRGNVLGRTDASGDVQLECPIGLELDVRVDSDEHLAVAERVLAPLASEEPSRTAIEVATGDDLRYFGRVLSAEDRRPVANATVRAIDNTDPRLERGVGDAQGVLRTAQADADGVFELDLPSRRQPTLEIEAPGLGLLIAHVDDRHATRETACEFRMQRAGTLEVRVAGVARFEGAQVEVRVHAPFLLAANELDSDDVRPIRDPIWRADASDTAPCRFTGLPAETPIDVALVAAGKTLSERERYLELQPGATLALALAAPSACRITGRVLSATGEPIAGKNVVLVPARARTRGYLDPIESGARSQIVSGADGAFAIDDVPAGRWWIGVPPENSPFDPPKTDAHVPLAEFVEIDSREEERRVDVVLQRGGYVSGRVVDVDGAPARHGGLRASTEQVAGVHQVRVDRSGHFVAGPLVEGEVELTMPLDRMSDGTERVRCRTGDGDVVLRIEKVGPLVVRVFDSTEGEPCEATVKYTDVDGSDVGLSVLEKSADGAHRGEVPLGRYYVTAVTSDGRIGMTETRVYGRGGFDTSIRVSLGPTVRARYRGKEPAVAVSVRCGRALVDFGTIPEGGVRDFVVLPERVTLTWYRFQGAAGGETFLADETTVDARHGQLHEVLFEVKD